MYLAIDIGGTKTLIANLSNEGTVLQSSKFLTSQNYKQFLKDLEAHVESMQISEKFLTCGIGVPGLVDREQGIVFSLGNLPWQNEYIRDDVKAILNGVPVIIENDSKLAGLSETRLLRGIYQTVLFLTISTGINGALVCNENIIKELEDAEMGKIPLQFEGALVPWEEFAGGRAVVERFGKKAMYIDDPESWKVIGTNIGYGVAILCSILQPEAIIFGGGVGAFADKFTETIGQYIDQHMHVNVRRPKALLAAKRPEEAVIYGCYELIKAYENTTS